MTAPRAFLLAASLCAACQSGTPVADAGVDAACAPSGVVAAWPAFPMPNPARSGLPHPAVYSISGGEVTDQVTGLIWQRAVDTTLFTWNDARQRCACATVDGHGGWRLPSRIELASLADWTVSDPAIDGDAFPDTPADAFWSASPMVEDPGLAWLVYFGTGFSSYDDYATLHHVRCVRGQPAAVLAPPDRYQIDGGTVFDRQTLLTWQQAEPPMAITWGDADAYCTSLALAGGGWRLPSIGELQTIVDESRSPSADAAAFPTIDTVYYWSSSRVVGDPAHAWAAFFANGSTYRMSITTPEWVRCVR